MQTETLSTRDKRAVMISTAVIFAVPMMFLIIFAISSNRNNPPTNTDIVDVSDSVDNPYVCVDKFNNETKASLFLENGVATCSCPSSMKCLNTKE